MKTTLADKWFSLFIRLRDCDDNGLGRCVTCGTIKEVKHMDCGHFVKRQHMATRFSEVNCAIQCKKCNGFEQGRDAEFERYLTDRWGEDKINLMKASARMSFKRGVFDIEILAKYYKDKVNQLIKSKQIKKWF